MAHFFIHNLTRPASQPIQAFRCSSFLCRLRGLMFRASLDPHEGLWMVQDRPDRANAAIHMFFMRFDIAVIWADANLTVVDAQLARRWRPAYVPARPAQFILETHPTRLDEFHPGDQLVLEPC